MLHVSQNGVPGPITFQIEMWAMASVKKCHRHVAEASFKSKSETVIKDMLLLFSVQEARSFWVPINRKWKASKKKTQILVAQFSSSCS